MNDTSIELLNSVTEVAKLDQLLWEILWKSLDLPRDIRDSFKLEGESLEFGAKVDNKLVGGLVANWISHTEVEIRHLAVRSEAHGQGIGTHLVTELLDHVAGQGCTRAHTIARNTTAGFLRKLGFKTATGEPPEHPLFKKYGITFELLEKDLEPRH